MSKITFPSVATLNAVNVINSNFSLIATALQNNVLYRANIMGEPNNLQDNIDANGKRIYNLPDPTSDGEPVTRGYAITGLTGDALATVQGYVDQSATNANNAANSATAAAASAAGAAAFANVPKWVSGTTYAINDLRFSPITNFTYRRIVAGAGTLDPSLDTTNWAATNAAAIGLTGFRNKVINGDMRIDQEYAGASATVTSGVDVYVGDQHIVRVSGANTTASIQTVALGTNNPKGLVINGAASVTNPTYKHRIESLNSKDLINKTVSISATVYQSTGSTQTLVGNLYSPSSLADTFSSVTLEGAITWQSTTLPNVTPIKVKGTTTLTNGPRLGLELQLGFNAAFGAGTLIIQDVQIEEGANATSFEQRPYEHELSRCYRYYWKRVSPTTQDFLAVGQCVNATTVSFVAKLPETMRISPNIGFGNVGATQAGGTLIGASSFSVLPVGPENYGAQLTFGTSSFVSGNAALICLNAIGGAVVANARL